MKRTISINPEWGIFILSSYSTRSFLAFSTFREEYCGPVYPVPRFRTGHHGHIHLINLIRATRLKLRSGWPLLIISALATADFTVRYWKWKFNMLPSSCNSNMLYVHILVSLQFCNWTPDDVLDMLHTVVVEQKLQPFKMQGLVMP